jgi:hypothetical protein
MKKNVLILFILLSCHTIFGQKNSSAIEKELEKLKKQAVCDCIEESYQNCDDINNDGSTYTQIINLNGVYIINDKKYWAMIKKWLNIKYKSHDPNNSLILMKCLDLYTSTELKLYIDSVRQNELRLLKIKNK